MNVIYPWFLKVVKWQRLRVLHCPVFAISYAWLPKWHFFLEAAVVLHIMMCLLIFYTVYYMMGSICWGVFRLSNFSAQIPFEFEMHPSYMDPNNLARLLSMEITYFTSGILFAALLRQWVWDYAITVTLTHMLLTFTVMKEFPLVWQWWMALASGLFLMICSGELVICLACSASNNLSRNECS